MKILVLMKMVPDIVEELEVAGDGGRDVVVAYSRTVNGLAQRTNGTDAALFGLGTIGAILVLLLGVGWWRAVHAAPDIAELTHILKMKSYLW